MARVAQCMPEEGARGGTRVPPRYEAGGFPREAEPRDRRPRRSAGGRSCELPGRNRDSEALGAEPGGRRLVAGTDQQLDPEPCTADALTGESDGGGLEMGA
jgi:hypothetical protein